MSGPKRSRAFQLPKPTETSRKVEAPPELIAEAEEVERRYEEAMRKRSQVSAASYHDAPAKFVLECIRWAEGEAPTRYQLLNMQRLVKHRRLAVRGPHGLGKTAQNAWVVLWFALTRDAAGEDWKVITTASAWRQLTHYLWPEIRKWSKQLDWKRLGREPFTGDEMMQMNLRLSHGEAFAAACDNPATIEGAHADQMLYIYDEAKTIPPETFDATEGAFSGAGSDTRMEAYAQASSTPGEPNGRFYEIHARRQGLLNWYPVHVTLEDAIEAQRISAEWAKEAKDLWGVKSAIYINRVLGNFAASEEDGVIPLTHIEEAVERWERLHDEGFPDLGSLTIASADIARSGSDRTVIALRYGQVIKELKRYSKQDTMPTAGIIYGLLRAEEGRRKAVVDVANVGGGVVDRLRELGGDVVPFNASERSTHLDRSGTLGMLNARASAWWNLREMLMPESGFEIALPPDELLIGDLTAPKWKVTSGGKIQVESKEEVRKRIKRSTDDGDAVVMAFYPDIRGTSGPPIILTGTSRWGPLRQRAWS